MALLPSTDAFAQTYNTPGVKDPLEAIEAYQEYQREWANTELGSHAISTRMELPRGRIRTWQDGGKPDVVRGIEVARENGWIECPVDSEVFAALTRLVAGVYSGGSISECVFVPSFSAPDSVVESQLRSDLETLGAGCRLALSNSGNVEELRPESDASVLGRILVALGAPHGPKTETVDRLPSFLDSAPDDVRREFVCVYVANRGVAVDGREFIQIIEQRPEKYLASLASLIDSVVATDVWHSGTAVRMYDDGLDDLGLS